MLLPTTPGHRAECPCLYCTQEAGFRCPLCKCPINQDGKCTSCYDVPTPAADPNVKATNPKDAIGAAKASTWFVPSRVLMEVGVAMLEGARKYGPFNWRTAGVCASVYIGAAERHLTAWKEGEDLDPASGLSHITKAIAGLTVLRDSMIEGNWQDDRPPSVSAGWVERLSEVAKEILARYPQR